MTAESVRDASVKWVCRSLHAEGVPCDDLLASRYVGVAEHYDVAIELLVTWIHERHAGKEWTVERWARWCALYRDTVKRLATEHARTEVEEQHGKSRSAGHR